MARKVEPATPPREALPEGESNRYLAKFKTTLGKKWSLTRMETLYEIFDLAAFLWALERTDEALAIAASVATAVPVPPPLGEGRVNYNIWCPATFSHALLVHLDTGTWRERAEASRAQLLREAGIARGNPGFIASRVAGVRELAEAPPMERAGKWECQGLARSLGSLVLYSELAKAGDSLFEQHGAETAVLIPQLLAKLRTALQIAK